MTARVAAVACDGTHRFSKVACARITLLAGLGVAGDAHAGRTVQHRSRVATDPTQPNLRQVHLIHAELLDSLARGGIALAPGALGENVLTRGIDLLALPRGTVLRLGNDATVEITGLRNPCAQIERFRPGLLAAVLERAPDGALIRKAGVMGIVRAGGDLRPGDAIGIDPPPPPHHRLAPV